MHIDFENFDICGIMPELDGPNQSMQDKVSKHFQKMVMTRVQKLTMVFLAVFKLFILIMSSSIIDSAQCEADLADTR